MACLIQGGVHSTSVCHAKKSLQRCPHTSLSRKECAKPTPAMCRVPGYCWRCRILIFYGALTLLSSAQRQSEIAGLVSSERTAFGSLAQSRNRIGSSLPGRQVGRIAQPVSGAGSGGGSFAVQLGRTCWSALARASLTGDSAGRLFWVADGAPANAPASCDFPPGPPRAAPSRGSRGEQPLISVAMASRRSAVAKGLRRGISSDVTASRLPPCDAPAIAAPRRSHAPPGRERAGVPAGRWSCRRSPSGRDPVLWPGSAAISGR